ncbi:type II toxin-antitoxin system HigB family toxin [Flavobacterium sp.]|jgi:hypothetical protein|uniref:type II toxin-antitoxin system HigB family toxin n=1 Tax=Flavobacterium sp. TaxID=239 RepID=UPI0037BFCE1F
MRLIGKNKLEKLKAKNGGNTVLCSEVDKLISDIENNDWKNQSEVKASRKDADCVHSDGFYFFNISVHRTMILLELGDDGEATVVWTGTHQEYESTFKNNKSTIKKWLKSKNHI